MPIITRCPTCDRHVRVPDDLLGQQVRCPSCQTVFHAQPDMDSSEPEETREPYPHQRGMFDDLASKYDPSRNEAERQVYGPALALMIVSGIAIGLGILSFVLQVVALGLAGNNPRADPVDLASHIINAVILLVWGGVVYSAAKRMKQLSSYGYAMAGSIVAMLPCCCWFGLPFGIWAVVVLCKPEVKAAFDRGRY